MLLKMFLVGFDDAEASNKRTILFSPNYECIARLREELELSNAIENFRVIRELNPNGFTMNDEPKLRVPPPIPKPNEYDEPE